MKQTLLSTTANDYRKKLFLRIFLCVVIFALTISLSLVLVFSRTEQNHKAHLIVNILADALSLSFLLAYFCVRILPSRRLLRLATANKTSSFSGVILSIDGQTEYVESFECYRIKAQERVFFLPKDGAIKLQEGQKVTLSLVGHFIVEADCD